MLTNAADVLHCQVYGLSAALFCARVEASNADHELLAGEVLLFEAAQARDATVGELDDL